MVILIGIVLVLVVAYFLFRKYATKKYDEFLRFYDGIQENTVMEANALLNILLQEFSNEPREDKGRSIFDILSQNKTLVILTFLDNNDPNDNQTLSITNSINFRTIKNGVITVFTDFDIMRNYFGNYISTEIILIGDFVKLCSDFSIKKIILNPTLSNPFLLTTEK